MKGLMIKDLCLLRNQRRILPIYLILAVWFTALHNDGFAFPFLMMMASILTVSTISYDEIDRSQAYLFALPIDRKTYVQEKFLLGGILGAVSLLLAVVCSAVRMRIEPGLPDPSLGSMTLLSACAGMAMLAVMIPIRIRFGGDQGRIVLYAVFGLIALAIVLVSKFLPGLQGSLTQTFSRLGMTAVLSAAAGASCLLALAGYLLGLRWIGQKEF